MDDHQQQQETIDKVLQDCRIKVCKICVYLKSIDVPYLNVRSGYVKGLCEISARFVDKNLFNVKFQSILRRINPNF